MARYVIAATPLAGHVMPMTSIAKSLRRRGDEVHFLTARQFCGQVEGAEASFHDLGVSGRVELPSPSGFPAPSLVRRFLSGRAEMRSIFIAPLAHQFRSLDCLLSRVTADAILADLAFTGVLPILLGDAPRPPVLVCGVGPLTLSSSDAPPFGLAWLPKPGVDYAAMTRTVNRLLFRGVQADIDRALHECDARGAPVGIPDWPRLADRLLQLTVPEFEYPRRDLPERVEFVGPILPHAIVNYEPPDWWHRVLAAKTVVHVTQGTLDNGNLDQLIGTTLRALSDQDVVVVATTGRRSDNAPRLHDSPNLFITEWIPYSFMLPHVNVMVTNGGYGGVQHALSHGIPLVVAGETSDKAEVAARVEYTGAGINLRTAAPPAADVAAAVRRVLGTPSYRWAARELAVKLCAAKPLDAIADALDAVSGRTPSHG